MTDSMDGQADGAVDIRIERWYLPEEDFPIWEFVRRFGRKPNEGRKKDADAEPDETPQRDDSNVTQLSCSCRMRCPGEC